MEDLRTVLLITLSILVVAVAYRRFKQYVMLHHGPAPRHLELLAVEVMYHPARLRVHVSMPAQGTLAAAMLSQAHQPLLAWPDADVAQGEHVLELPLGEDLEGPYFLHLSSATQRMERRFIVRRA